MGADGWYGPVAQGAYTGYKGFFHLLSALRPGSGSTPELRLIKVFDCDFCSHVWPTFF